jgi:hypothetical protein
MHKMKKKNDLLQSNIFKNRAWKKKVWKYDGKKTYKPRETVEISCLAQRKDDRRESNI